MELVCEKYKEKVAAEKAICRRPTEYCKFRSSCMIHFLSKENAANQADDEKVQQESEQSPENK